jgi:hypothetical protein
MPLRFTRILSLVDKNLAQRDAWHVLPEEEFCTALVPLKSTYRSAISAEIRERSVLSI